MAGDGTGAASGTVRAATAADGEALREIERRAGERFRAVGLDAVADDEPPSLATLAGYASAGRSWVATDGAGTPIGYLIADVVDGCAHVEQVSVHPDHQGAGVGRALLDRVEAWAAAAGLPALTLTTFADVPWNGPLYAHLGFRALASADIGPELRAVVAAETAHGLDPATRICMRRDLPAGHAGRMDETSRPHRPDQPDRPNSPNRPNRTP